MNIRKKKKNNKQAELNAIDTTTLGHVIDCIINKQDNIQSLLSLIQTRCISDELNCAFNVLNNLDLLNKDVHEIERICFKLVKSTDYIESAIGKALLFSIHVKRHVENDNAMNKDIVYV